MDKRDRNILFRTRIVAAMQLQGQNQSSLSRAIGCNRSTISQLLDEDSGRLPNAQLVAELGSTLGVSTDWLLGLTDRPERAVEIFDAAYKFSEACRTAADDQIIDWHHEANGYKIRHVPATLPDIMKSPAFLSWEYQTLLGKTPGQAISNMEERLAWLRQTDSDYEIALPKHTAQSVCQQVGYYEDCPTALAQDQMKYFAELCDSLFPKIRVHFFDARQVFSAPITVFGRLHAVIYVGNCYLSFRESSRIDKVIDHFDLLVRRSSVQSHDVGDWVRSLLDS